MSSEHREYPKIKLPSFDEVLNDGARFWELPSKRQGRLINHASREERLSDLPIEDIMLRKGMDGLKLKLALSLVKSSNENERHRGLSILEGREDLQAKVAPKLTNDKDALTDLYISLQNPASELVRQVSTSLNPKEIEGSVDIIALKPYSRWFFHKIISNEIVVSPISFKLILWDFRKAFKEGSFSVVGGLTISTATLKLVFETDALEEHDMSFFMRITYPVRGVEPPKWFLNRSLNITERNKRIVRLFGLRSSKNLLMSLRNANIMELGLFKQTYEPSIRVTDKNRAQEIKNRRKHYAGSGFHELDPKYVPHVNFVSVALNYNYNSTEENQYNMFDDVWWDWVPYSKNIAVKIWRDHASVHYAALKNKQARDLEKLMESLHSAKEEYLEEFFSTDFAPLDIFVSMIGECCDESFCIVKRSLSRVPSWKVPKRLKSLHTELLAKHPEEHSIEEEDDMSFLLTSTENLLSRLDNIDKSSRRLDPISQAVRCEIVNELKIRGIEMV